MYPCSGYIDLYFCTYTIYKWNYLLKNIHCKRIICNCFDYLVKNNYCKILFFVIMDNHLHFIIHVNPPHSIDSINNKFRSFTSKQLLQWLKEFQLEKISDYTSAMHDRTYQIWEPSPLCVEIVSENFFIQKTEYIHNNPVNAMLVKDPIDYKWSSANFYETGDPSEFEFLDCSLFEE
ncbi:MAG: transposase [Saprospiraceae bacterium]|nr:transposase [Saprospiraceae bacterium]